MNNIIIQGRMAELVNTARQHLRQELEEALAHVHALLSNLVGTPNKVPHLVITLKAKATASSSPSSP